MDFNLKEFVNKLNANKDSLLWSIARECGYDLGKVIDSKEIKKYEDVEQDVEVEEKEKHCD